MEPVTLLCFVVCNCFTVFLNLGSRRDEGNDAGGEDLAKSDCIPDLEEQESLAPLGEAEHWRGRQLADVDTPFEAQTYKRLLEYCQSI